MRKTTISRSSFNEAICVDTAELMQLLHCGRVSATKLGTEAGAKVQIGKRVLWSTDKVKEYINGISF
jgi:hypothetical protein